MHDTLATDVALPSAKPYLRDIAATLESVVGRIDQITDDMLLDEKTETALEQIRTGYAHLRRYR